MSREPLRIAGASGFRGDGNDARLDPQGKTYGYALIRMQIEGPDDLPVEQLV